MKPSDCKMHTTDNQGYCAVCGIPMGVSDDEWLVMQAMTKDEWAKGHILIIAKDVLRDKEGKS